MEKMWLVVAEIIGKSDRSPESEIGFMNITTWADSKEAASSKIEEYLDSFGWHLVQVDKADVIDEDFQCDDVLADMIERTRNNANAIILGTFHTYKTN
jgi:predicted oxidoreductase